jgi:hypothetical protein
VRDAAAGPAGVVVDDLGVAPAKLLDAIDETLLAPSTLMIMQRAGLLSIVGYRRHYMASKILFEGVSFAASNSEF